VVSSNTGRLLQVQVGVGAVVGNRSLVKGRREGKGGERIGSTEVVFERHQQHGYQLWRRKCREKSRGVFTLDRKSTSGMVFMLGGGAVSWGSKKQSTVYCSTT